MDASIRSRGSRRSSHGKWVNSRFSALPEIQPELSSRIANLLVIAGGLALILSRCAEPQIKRHFPATQALHCRLQADLCQSGDLSLPTSLVNDVAHEIAELADPSTKNALRLLLAACIRRDLEQERRLLPPRALRVCPQEHC